jgi:putative glutamine amidotransferase
MKLYCALWSEDGYPFAELADEVQVVHHPDEFSETEDGILVVWGGADIDPALYKHPASSRSGFGGRRDVLEWVLMQGAVKRGIPIIGVCRGAQMLCALAGGYLLQDVANHGGRHEITTITGEKLMVNSIHHQMMEPSMTDHELLAWVTQNRSEGLYIWKDDQNWNPPEGWKEPEFVYFKEVKGFGIQWHPEMMDYNAPATQYVLNTIKEKLCLNTIPA